MTSEVLRENKSIKQKYLLVYHSKMKLSSDVQIILNTCTDEHSGFAIGSAATGLRQVTDFVPASSAVHLRMQE